MRTAFPWARRLSTPMNTRATTASLVSATASVMVNMNGRAMTMGTASVKSTATPPKGCGPMCATSFVRSKGFIRRTWLATLPCVNSDAISNVSRPLSLLNWLPFTLFTHEPLNWVREWDRPTFVDLAGESQAAGWRNFFATNTGMFLRNAVIYQLGMIQHYQSQGLIPQSPLGSGSVEIGDGLVRLTPDTNSNNIIGNAAGSLLQPVEIFGWLSVSTPSEQLPYWLLV